MENLVLGMVGASLVIVAFGVGFAVGFFVADDDGEVA